MIKEAQAGATIEIGGAACRNKRQRSAVNGARKVAFDDVRLKIAAADKTTMYRDRAGT